MKSRLVAILPVVALVAVAGLLVCNTAFAANEGFTTTAAATGVASGTESELITSVTNWVLGITGAIAVLFIIYGGFRYITASGNQTQMEQAKNILIKAIIGLVIVLVAYVIVTAVVGALV